MMGKSMEWIEDWLRQRGVDPNELGPEAPPVIEDYGNALALLLSMVNSLGEANVQLLAMCQNQQAQIDTLQNQVEAMQNA